MSVSNANARALALMDRLSARTGLTTESRNAILQLVNPFADFDVPRTGYFDTNESSSVVSCVKYSQTYAAPVGLAVGANWDLHVCSTPRINPSSTVAPGTMAAGDLFYTNSGNPYSVGGVTVMAGPVGTALTFTNLCTLGAGTPSYIDGLSLSPQQTQFTSASGLNYLDGQCRVIGMGFEVHNTTSPLNAQGAVAVYRQPQPVWLDRSVVRTMGVSAGTIQAPTTVQYQGSSCAQIMYDVPAGLNQCMLLAGTRQWEAKDGCMVVPTLNDMNIPVQKPNPAVTIMLNNSIPVVLTGISNAAQIRTGYNVACTANSVIQQNGQVTPTTTTVQTIPLDYVHAANFNTGGAYFTGLSNTTTLTVNSIYYIERFPTPNDTNLVVLANPSPPYSSVAMDLYPEMMRFLPTGCKVADNADGDWFFEAIKTVSDFLGPALGAAGAFVHPALGPAAIGFSKAASSWADMKLKDRNPGQANAKKGKGPKTNPLALPPKPKQARAAPVQGGPPRPPTVDKAHWRGLSLKERKKLYFFVTKTKWKQGA